MSEIEKIKRLEKINDIIMEKMRKYGYVGIELKDGSYFYFYGSDFAVISDFATEYIILEQYNNGKRIFEIRIKAKNIKDIFPKVIKNKKEK